MYKRHSHINDSDSHNHIDNMKVMMHVHYQLQKLEDLILSKKSIEGNVLFLREMNST